MRRLNSFLIAAIVSSTFLMAPPAVPANPAFDRGAKLYQARDYNGALKQFAAAAAAGYQTPNALYYQALCHHQLGHIDKARELYNALVTKYGTSGAAVNARTALQQLSAPAPAAAATFQQPFAYSKADYQQAITPPRVVSPQPAGNNGEINCEIPYTDGPAGMVVPVQVGGHWMTAVWDTGAAPVYFPKSQLEQAGIDLRNTTKAGAVSGIGGEVQTQRLMTTVRVGNQAIQMPILVEDDTATRRNSEGPHLDFGLLGEHFFGRYVYEVDPAAHVIRLIRRTNVSMRTPPRTVSRASGNDVPFRWEEGQIIVTPKVNGRECEMIFDTGAHSIAFNDKQLTAIGMTRPTNSRGALSYGIGGARAAYQFALKEVSLGPITRREVPASIDVFGTQDRPLLGQTFLGGLKYRIDPERCIIHFAD